MMCRCMPRPACVLLRSQLFGRTRGLNLQLVMASSAVAAVDDSGPTLLDGRELSRRLRRQIKADVEALIRKHGVVPHLAIVTVGERPPEEQQRRELFAGQPGDASWFDKPQGASEVGMRVTHVRVPSNEANFQTVKDHLERLGGQHDVHGLLLEQPLPPSLQVDCLKLWQAIPPAKDVDGMHPENAGRLLNLAAGLEEHYIDVEADHEASNLPTTPVGAMRYIDECGFDISVGARCVIIGRSKLVGLPLACLLLARDATVTVAHSRTPVEELKQLCRQADVVVAAAGVPRLIKADWLKPGALAINVGTTFSPREKAMIGDVHWQDVPDNQNIVTRTPKLDTVLGSVGPSGVGPMTLPMLLNNTLQNTIRSVKAEKAKLSYKMMHGCRRSTPALSDKEVAEAMGSLGPQGWSLIEGDTSMLQKTFVTKDFVAAVELINHIKRLAERYNHHPDVHLTKYRELTVQLRSVVTSSVTRYDAEFANAIERLPYAIPDPATLSIEEETCRP